MEFRIAVFEGQFDAAGYTPNERKAQRAKAVRATARVCDDEGVTMDFSQVVRDVPQLRRGRVWCRTCGSTQRVDSATALREGWPSHCGYTMTIDSPTEQRRHERLDGEAVDSC